MNNLNVRQIIFISFLIIAVFCGFDLYKEWAKSRILPKQPIVTYAFFKTFVDSNGKRKVYITKDWNEWHRDSSLKSGFGVIHGSITTGRNNVCFGYQAAWHSTDSSSDYTLDGYAH